VKNLKGSLRAWLTRQKQKAGEDDLEPVRRARLEEIGIDLASYKPRKSNFDEIEWDRHFARLEEYVRSNGRCDVPYRYKEDPSLGR
jgi:hypothetical protein